MILRFRPILLILVIIITFGCDDGSGRRLPRHSGEAGEILVVMNEKSWLGTPGDSLRAILEASVPQLPQGEPSFSLLQFSQGEMSGLLRQHRNILQVVIGVDAEGVNKVSWEKDKWSNHQVVVSIRATDEKNFYRLLQKDMAKITSLLNQTEIERLQRQLVRFGNEKIESKIADKFGISIDLPADCEISVHEKDFVWIKRERLKYLGNTAHEITQGFFIYTYPYISDSAFTQESLLQMRDSILKMYVPGPSKGTYMTTEYRFPPSSQVITFNDKYSVMTRGLWKTENAFMGGPFISLATTSQDGDKVVVISGFVFAPKFDKREYVREVEAVLRSVKPL